MSGLGDLEFPLCVEAATDAAARPAVLEALRFLERESGGPAFEAVILTGSFSRGEGSVLLASPRHRILGDIEFLAIAKPPYHYPKLRRDMRRLGARATNRMRELGYDVSVEYSPAGRRYLQRTIKPSIFAFDLLSHGKTVSGDRALLDSVPRFDRASIPKEDAVQLVMNRMMELHALRMQAGTDRIQQAYLGTKTALDLAGSVLAFEGSYVSRYRARPEALRKLPTMNPLSKDFREIEDAVQMKLYPDGNALLENAPGLEVTLDRAMDVWRWEMQGLVGGQSVRDLLNGFLAKERTWQTLRGWIKYYTHPLRPSADPIPLWRRLRLLFLASPHRLAYASALLAYQEERSNTGIRKEAARLLPSGREDQPLPRAVELWSWLVRNN